MIGLPEIKTAELSTYGNFASVTRPSSAFRVRAWVRGYTSRASRNEIHLHVGVVPNGKPWETLGSLPIQVVAKQALQVAALGTK